MFKQTLEEEASKWGTSMSKAEFVKRMAYAMQGAGLKVHTINSLYLNVEGKEYQFIKSKKDGCWKVKDLF